MAPRKKRGSKTQVNRKGKTTPINNLPNVHDTDVVAVQDLNTDDVKDNVSSITYHREANKPTVVTRAHKKFGKFRFLLEVSAKNINLRDV